MFHKDLAKIVVLSWAVWALRFRNRLSYEITTLPSLLLLQSKSLFPPLLMSVSVHLLIPVAVCNSEVLSHFIVVSSIMIFTQLLYTWIFGTV